MIHGFGIAHTAERQHTAEDNYRYMLLTFPVCNIELVTSKINLHLTSRDVSVVVRQVVSILIITDMLLELRVPAVWSGGGVWKDLLHSLAAALSTRFSVQKV